MYNASSGVASELTYAILRRNAASYQLGPIARFRLAAPPSMGKGHPKQRNGESAGRETLLSRSYRADDSAPGSEVYTKF